MSENNWKTLRVPPEAYERAKEQKDEHDRTWGEQLVCEDPTTINVVAVDDLEDIGAGADGESIDYAEIESRCQSAIETELEGRHR